MVEKEFRRETDNRMGNSANPKTGVNYAAMLDRVGGDETLQREITSIFLEEYPILLTEIRRCIVAADATALERAAHSLKGSVSNFGALAATRSAYTLEVIARGRRLDEAPLALWQLEREFGEIELELLAILANRS
jgi:HPt (histidine-containing phosphotransfer) domain-containing protein